MAEQPLRVELEQELDGSWLAEVVELPGVLVYGAIRDDALAKAEALALRVIADRREHGERAPELTNPPSAPEPVCGDKLNPHFRFSPQTGCRY